MLDADGSGLIDAEELEIGMTNAVLPAFAILAADHHVHAAHRHQPLGDFALTLAAAPAFLDGAEGGGGGGRVRGGGVLDGARVDAARERAVPVDRQRTVGRARGADVAPHAVLPERRDVDGRFAEAGERDPPLEPEPLVPSP